MKRVIPCEHQSLSENPIQLEFLTLSYLVAAVLRSYRGGGLGVRNVTNEVMHVVMEQAQASADLVGYLLVECQFQGVYSFRLQFVIAQDHWVVNVVKLRERRGAEGAAVK